MFSKILHLTVGSRDLSHAENSTIYILLKNDNSDHFELSFCEFAQLVRTVILSQLVINNVIQQSTEES